MLRRRPFIGAVVVGVEHKLPDEMVTDRPALEPMFSKKFVPALAVGGIGCSFGDIEMIAPAGELKAVVAPRCCLLRQGRERKVRPLSGEKCYGSCQVDLPIKVGK